MARRKATIVELWDRTMAINLRSQMLMCKHAIPEMVVRGHGGPRR